MEKFQNNEIVYNPDGIQFDGENVYNDEYNKALKEKQQVWKKYISKAKKGIPFEEAWETYINDPIHEKFKVLERQHYNVKMVEFTDIPNEATVYTFAKFCKLAKSKILLDTDGIGYYGTDQKMSNIVVLPTDVIYDQVNNNFTHVIWIFK